MIYKWILTTCPPDPMDVTMNIPSDIRRSNDAYSSIFIACPPNANHALENIVSRISLNWMIYKWIFTTCSPNPTNLTMNIPSGIRCSNTTYSSIFIACPPNRTSLAFEYSMAIFMVTLLLFLLSAYWTTFVIQYPASDYPVFPKYPLDTFATCIGCYQADPCYNYIM